jgi:glycosyltransferase involved in cell wall biosynthesis
MAQIKAVEAPKKLDLSIIVPLYNEEDSLPHLIKSVQETMKKTKLTWELICVDDGSKDGTVAVMEKEANKCPEFRPIYLRRNYGQTAAMQAGFDHAQGNVFITMDGDLQNDPSDIPMLLEIMKKEDADIVSGWRKNRKDDAFRTFLSRNANKLLSRVTGVRLHDFGCSLKAYRAEAMEGVHIYGELHRFIPAIVAQNGAKVVEVEVKHHAREYGVSKYGNIGRMFKVFLDVLLLRFMLKYLHRPLHAFGMTGIISLAIGGLLATYLTVLKLFGESIGGRPLLILSVMLIILGVQLIGMGILGDMLMRIYHEPQGRKQYSLRRKK